VIEPFMSEVKRRIPRPEWLALRGSHPVLLQGCSGAGKTKALEALRGNFEAKPLSARTEEAIRVLLIDPQNARRIAITDVPGDLGNPAFANERLEANDEHRLRTTTILNVVSFGFHSIQLDDSMYPVDPDSALQRQSDFLIHEIETMAEWADFGGRTRSPVNVLTLITKPDLWWDRREEVLAYYVEGPYDKALSDLGSSERQRSSNSNHTSSQSAAQSSSVPAAMARVATAAKPGIFNNIVHGCQLVDEPQAELGTFYGHSVCGSRPTQKEVRDMRSSVMSALRALWEVAK
jgi:hypothetical protein